jgi:hypothetical protein
MGRFTRTTAIAFEPHRLEIVELYEGAFSSQRISAWSIPIPPSGICDVTGAITDVSGIEECLVRAMSKPALLMRNRVAIALPSVALFFRSISVASKVCQADPQRVHETIRGILPCDASSLVYGIAVSPHDDEQCCNVLVVAVKRDLFTAYSSVAAFLGREISLVMPACIARWHVVSAQLREGEHDPVLVVHTFGPSVEATLWYRNTLLGCRRSVVPDADRTATMAWWKSPEGIEECTVGITDGLSAAWRERIRTRCRVIERDGACSRELRIRLGIPRSSRRERQVRQFHDCLYQRTAAYDAALGLLYSIGESSALQRDRLV